MGLNSRWYGSLPTVTSDTVFISLPANAEAGTAESFKEAVVDQIEGDAGTITKFPRTLWLCNDTGATIYIRGREITAAATGDGVPIPALGILEVSWQSEPDNMFLYEAAAAFTVACFF